MLHVPKLPKTTKNTPELNAVKVSFRHFGGLPHSTSIHFHQMPPPGPRLRSGAWDPETCLRFRNEKISPKCWTNLCIHISYIHTSVCVCVLYIIHTHTVHLYAHIYSAYTHVILTIYIYIYIYIYNVYNAYNVYNVYDV